MSADTPSLLENSLKAVRRDVELCTENFFEAKIANASAIKPAYARLWRTIAELHRAGGKRLRPYMVSLGYRAFGGTDYRSIIPVMAAWELLHLCMLIHDDIIDRDTVRYGVKNITGSYLDIYSAHASHSEALHLANSAALTAGDLLLSSAYELVLSSDLKPEDVIVSQKYLAAATFAVAGGELLDSEAVLEDVRRTDSQTIVLFKTASYSFVGPLQAGAALAGASEQKLEQVRRFGEMLGSAFQLTDDLLGVFGDSSVTGKSASSDISEAKRTVLLQEAYARADTAGKAVLNAHVGNAKLTDAQANEVRDVMQRTGAKKAVEDMVADYVVRARQIVEELPIDTSQKQEFNELIAAATKRKY